MLKSNAGRALVANLLLTLFFVSLPVAFFALYWLATMPDVAALAKTNPHSTALIESRLAAARQEGRWLKPQQRWTSFSRISPYLKRAVIVGEDARFYSHEGFDWRGIKNAAISNLQRGKLHRGGSTITQQLAKNLYLSPKKNFLRKIREAMIARSLEHTLSKTRILEIYLNVVEWGHNVYGAEAAARHHFRKSASALTREEAALLSAILPAPRKHDPLRMTSALKKRQQHFLGYMDGAMPANRHRLLPLIADLLPLVIPVENRLTNCTQRAKIPPPFRRSTAQVGRLAIDPSLHGGMRVQDAT